eukprot:TRINITY_DN59075_c0_g1_i2.p1 TRINITY_DN59075_c0_g1~~TRINITY_DN59075_c0_g1_i2.p1  ORF type:complete len:129 (-),score=27.02 TRINITY_DN59075_c0_g1_i2:65-451(-)
MIRRPPRSTQGVSSAASDVYKRQGKQHADILNSSAMKMTFLKKAALCYKDLLLHEQALFLLKQLMQVTWACSDTSRELEVYDLIGMEYYYLGKMEKAIFYHERMMHSCLLYTSPSPRDLSTSRMPSSA